MPFKLVSIGIELWGLMPQLLCLSWVRFAAWLAQGTVATNASECWPARDITLGDHAGLPMGPGDTDCRFPVHRAELKVC